MTTALRQVVTLMTNRLKNVLRQVVMLMSVQRLQVHKVKSSVLGDYVIIAFFKTKGAFKNFNRGICCEFVSLYEAKSERRWHCFPINQQL